MTTKQDKIGPTITKFLKLKAKISKLNKDVTDLKSEAHDMEKGIIIALESEKTERMDVKAGSVSLKKKMVFNVKDKKAFRKYLLKSKDIDILEGRVGQAHLRELYEDGVKVPGTEKMTKKSLSVGRKRG